MGDIAFVACSGCAAGKKRFEGNVHSCDLEDIGYG